MRISANSATCYKTARRLTNLNDDTNTKIRKITLEFGNGEKFILPLEALSDTAAETANSLASNVISNDNAYYLNIVTFSNAMGLPHEMLSEILDAPPKSDYVVSTNDYLVCEDIEKMGINCRYKDLGRVNVYEKTSNNKLACFINKQVNNCVGYMSAKYKSATAEYYAFSFNDNKMSRKRVQIPTSF